MKQTRFFQFGFRNGIFGGNEPETARLRHPARIVPKAGRVSAYLYAVPAMTQKKDAPCRGILFELSYQDSNLE